MRQGAATEAERIMPAETSLILELSGRGMDRTQSIMEMKEAEEANAPPGLGCLQRPMDNSGDQV